MTPKPSFLSSSPLPSSSSSSSSSSSIGSPTISLETDDNLSQTCVDPLLYYPYKTFGQRACAQTRRQCHRVFQKNNLSNYKKSGFGTINKIVDKHFGFFNRKQSQTRTEERKVRYDNSVTIMSTTEPNIIMETKKGMGDIYHIPWWFSSVDVKESESNLFLFLNILSTDLLCIIALYCRTVPIEASYQITSRLESVSKKIVSPPESNYNGKRLLNGGPNVLGYIISTNSTIIELDLSHRMIDYAGARFIAIGLKQNTVLTVLKLDSNKIGDIGAKFLSGALKMNSVLRDIRLDRNKINHSGMIAISKSFLKNSTLRVIGINGNNGSDRGVQYLAQSLEFNSTLTELGFGRNKLSDLGAIYIAKALNKNQTLTAISIKQNKIGNVGTVSLCTALEINSTLKKMGLGNNEIGDIGSEAISEMLKKNSTLIKLFLDNNKITDIGAQKIAAGLKQNKTLLYIDLENNKFRRQGSILFEEIVANLPSTRKIFF